MQYQLSSRSSPIKSSSSNIVLHLNNDDDDGIDYKIKKQSHGSTSSMLKLESETTDDNNSVLVLSSDDDEAAVECSSSSDLKQHQNNTNDSDEVNYSSFNHQNVLIEKHGGLSNKNTLVILCLWYLFSALTLFTNKYIVSHGKGDPILLGAIQMAITSLCGFIQINYNKYRTLQMCESGAGGSGGGSRSGGNIFVILMHRFHFWRDMLIVGSLRLFSIILGLVALKQSSISFVETIKSSSPLFTVVISRLLIGEITGLFTNLSLIPIMVGLLLCSSFEINFSLFGFFAAIFTNLTECLQMVFSKLLLCGEKYKYTPLELQFFTSCASCLVLIPVCLFTIDLVQILSNLTFKIILLYFLNAFLYHGQTFLAFTLMSFISPVTYSVCNTLKRALLIMASVLIFQNHVVYMSAVGTIVTICGVFFYNHVRHFEHARLAKSLQQMRKNAN